MECFICKTNVTLRCMSKHFKLIHSLNENDTYRCTFGRVCFQYFSSFSSLTRHFKSHLNSVQATCRSDNTHISPHNMHDFFVNDSMIAGSSQKTFCLGSVLNETVDNVTVEMSKLPVP